MDRRSTMEANASAFGRGADCSLVDQIRADLKSGGTLDYSLRPPSAVVFLQQSLW